MSRIVKRSTSQPVKPGSSRRDVALPGFIPPQLSQPVDKPPSSIRAPGGYLRPKLEPHREFLEVLRREKSDITLKALCDWLMAERGVKADTAMMSRFFRRLGVTLKKRRSSRASRIVRT